MEVLFSVRMRAAAGGPHEAGGRHVSGAERLVEASALRETMAALLRRAEESEPPSDFVRISMDRVPLARIRRIPALPVTTVAADGPEEARDTAIALLTRCGVSTAAVERAFAGLGEGFVAPGAPLRGAVLMHASTGRRLDADPARGVRARHLDYSPEFREEAARVLAEAGLSHFRTLEALAVASKVMWAGLLAELCWSDDPTYDAGYVATAEQGYVRFPVFRPAGATGGRVFFIKSPGAAAESVRRLEEEYTLIEPPLAIRSTRSPSEFIRSLDARQRASS